MANIRHGPRSTIAMSEDNKPATSSSSHIPPPTDPYARYQTPYDSSHEPDVNPFIEFRRFADRQFAALFGGVPKLFGVPHDARVRADARTTDEGEQSKILQEREDAWQKEVRDFVNEQSQIMSAMAREMDGMLGGMKQQMADKELARADMLYKLFELEQMNKKRLEMDRERKEDPPADKRNEKEKTTEPKTELDMYDAQRRQPQSSHPYGPVGSESSSLRSGEHPFDQHRPEPQPDMLHHASRASTAFGEWHTSELDPFGTPHDLATWLLMDDYSPINLAYRYRNFDGWHHRNSLAAGNTSLEGISNTEDAFTNAVAMTLKVPWADAFEDLLAHDITGKLPPFRREPNYEPSPWWYSRIVHKADMARSRMKATEAMTWSNGLMDRPSQLVKWPESTDEFANDAAKEGWEDEEDGLEDEFYDEEYASSNNSQPATNTKAADKHKDSPIIAQTTSTVTTRRPDGQYETKRVFTKRYADGTESTDESTEIRESAFPGTLSSIAQSLSGAFSSLLGETPEQTYTFQNVLHSSSESDERNDELNPKIKSDEQTALVLRHKQPDQVSKQNTSHVDDENALVVKPEDQDQYRKQSRGDGRRSNGWFWL